MRLFADQRFHLAYVFCVHSTAQLNDHLSVPCPRDLQHSPSPGRILTSVKSLAGMVSSCCNNAVIAGGRSVRLSKPSARAALRMRRPSLSSASISTMTASASGSNRQHPYQVVGFVSMLDTRELQF